MPVFEDKDVYPSVIKQVFESKGNIRGKRLNVLIVNALYFSEGVSFNHVRRVIVGSVPPSYSSLVQRVARASRACRHLEFPENDRYLYVDMYVPVLRVNDVVEYLRSLGCKRHEAPRLVGKVYKCVKIKEPQKKLTKAQWKKQNAVPPEHIPEPEYQEVPKAPRKGKKRNKHDGPVVNTAAIKASNARLKKEWQAAKARAKKAADQETDRLYNLHKSQHTGGERDQDEYTQVVVDAVVEHRIQDMAEVIGKNQDVPETFMGQICLVPEVERLHNVLTSQDDYEVAMCALWKASCDGSVLGKFMGDPARACEDYDRYELDRLIKVLETIGKLQRVHYTLYGAYKVDFPDHDITVRAPPKHYDPKKDYDRVPTDLDLVLNGYTNKMFWGWVRYLINMFPNLRTVYPSVRADKNDNQDDETERQRQSVMIYVDPHKKLWVNETVEAQLKEFRERNERVILPLTIVTANYGLHSNGLLIDYSARSEMTHFEPHGASTSSYDVNIMQAKLRDFATKHGIDNVKFVDSFCPKDGLQTLQQQSTHYETREKNGEFQKYRRHGICMVYTLMFIHLKLLNIGTSDHILFKYLNDHPNDVEAFAYSYLAYMNHELRNQDLVHEFTQTDGDYVVYKVGINGEGGGWDEEKNNH